MKFTPADQLVRAAFEEGYAIPSFFIWNAESIQTVLEVCEDCNSPVIIMNGPGEFGLLNPAQTGAIAHALAKSFSIPIALHLDHGDSLDQVQQCLDAGYSSVMLDFSARSLAENIAGVRTAVEMAKPLGVSVEGEIGAVGRVDNTTGEGVKTSTLTNPDEALEFAQATGIDMIAVSIGNSHGNYTALPSLDFERLRNIKQITGIPIVLHGGSGTPPEDVQKAISAGIAKINVASELNRAVCSTLMENWNAERLQWAPMAFAESMKAMAPIVEKWIRICQSNGKAGQTGNGAKVGANASSERNRSSR